MALRDDFRTSIRARRASSWSRRGRACCRAFRRSLSDAAHRSLEQLGVEVRLGRGGDGLRRRRRDARRRAHRARAPSSGRAGVWPRRPAHWLGGETDRAGRVKVDADLSVPGHPEIFVHRRHRARARRRRQAPARRRAGRQAAGRLRRPRCCAPGHGRQAPRPVPLSRLRLHGHDRPHGCRGRSGRLKLDGTWPGCCGASCTSRS